jgi:hypothetical protein
MEAFHAGKHTGRFAFGNAREMDRRSCDNKHEHPAESARSTLVPMQFQKNLSGMWDVRQALDNQRMVGRVVWIDVLESSASSCIDCRERYPI